MRNDNEPRLFWVVDSDKFNREIFASREEAEEFAESEIGNASKYSIIVSEVRNWYQENNGQYNYDDFNETFRDVITVVHNSPPVRGGDGENE